MSSGLTFLPSENGAKMKEKAAVVKENNGDTPMTVDEFTVLLNKLQEIKTSHPITEDQMVNDWQIETLSVNSENSSNLKGLLGIFGFTTDTGNNYSYCLIRMYKSATPESFVIDHGRLLKVERGYGIFACIEVQSSEKIASASALNMLSAKVELKKKSATIKLIPIGINGKKVSTKFSEVVGEFNVKTISNLYNAFDRIQEFEKDPTTQLTPQILKVQIVGKESVFLPDRVF